MTLRQPLPQSIPCSSLIPLLPVDIGVGMYDLTNAGKEILRLYLDEEFPYLDGYFDEVSNFWRGMGFEVEEVTA